MRATEKTKAGWQLASGAGALSDQVRKGPSGARPSEQSLDRGRGGRHAGVRRRELPGRGNNKCHEHKMDMILAGSGAREGPVQWGPGGVRSQGGWAQVTCTARPPKEPWIIHRTKWEGFEQKREML